MEKLVGHDKDREITYDLQSWIKQTYSRENQFNLFPIEIELDGEKPRQNLKHLSPPLTFFPSPASLLHSLLHSFSAALSSAGKLGMGGCSQSITVPLCCCFFLTCFLYCSIGPP